jgi:hypothetical protein
VDFALNIFEVKDQSLQQQCQMAKQALMAVDLEYPVVDKPNMALWDSIAPLSINTMKPSSIGWAHQ